MGRKDCKGRRGKKRGQKEIDWEEGRRTEEE